MGLWKESNLSHDCAVVVAIGIGLTWLGWNLNIIYFDKYVFENTDI